MNSPITTNQSRVQRIQSAASEKINFRIGAEQKELIDEAAEALGQNRTHFILETLCQKAHEVLADRTQFHLSEEKFTQFNRVLDEPVNDAAWRMLTKRTPWQSQP